MGDPMAELQFSLTVGPEKADEFATAIGAESMAHSGSAPPTYAMALIGPRLFELLGGVDLDPGRDTVLHTGQRFEYTRQLQRGETVDCRISMTEPRDELRGRFLELKCDFVAADGSPVLTATTGLLVMADATEGR